LQKLTNPPPFQSSIPPLALLLLHLFVALQEQAALLGPVMPVLSMQAVLGVAVL